MKTMKLNEFFNIVNVAPAVLMSHNVIIPAVTDPELIEEDEPFLTLSWSDDVGYIYRADFTPKDNKEVKVNGCEITLTDTDGIPLIIAILEQKNFNA